MDNKIWPCLYYVTDTSKLYLENLLAFGTKGEYALQNLKLLLYKHNI